MITCGKIRILLSFMRKKVSINSGLLKKNNVEISRFLEDNIIVGIILQEDDVNVSLYKLKCF